MSTNSPAAEAVAIRLERVPVTERFVSLLYVGAVGLMLTVLWAMAGARSLESQTVHYLPADKMPPAELQAELARLQVK